MLKFRKIPPKYLFLSLLVGVFIISILELTGVTHIFHDKKSTDNLGTASSETKGEPQDMTSNDSSSNQTSVNSNNKNSAGELSSNAPLLVPSGTFASNHRPSLSKDDVQSSSCTTTPGATCQIIFNKDGTTKSLTAQTTDNGGSTYWNWKPQDIGLSEGTWQIQAIARLNGQSQTTTDAISLEVSP